jgi:hypothetical protein
MAMNKEQFAALLICLVSDERFPCFDWNSRHLGEIASLLQHAYHPCTDFTNFAIGVLMYGSSRDEHFLSRDEDGDTKIEAFGREHGLLFNIKHDWGFWDGQHESHCDYLEQHRINIGLRANEMRAARQAPVFDARSTGISGCLSPANN